MSRVREEGVRRMNLIENLGQTGVVLFSLGLYYFVMMKELDKQDVKRSRSVQEKKK